MGANLNLTDIEWHPSGDFAVIIGDGGYVYRYVPGYEVWYEIDGDTGVVVDLRAITWNEFNNNFVVVGGIWSDSKPSAWVTDGYDPLTELGGPDTSPNNKEFHDVAIDTNGVVIAVGTGGTVFVYDGGWGMKSIISSYNDLFGITYNSHNEMFYCVGYQKDLKRGVLWEYNQTGGNVVEISPPTHGGWSDNPLFDIETESNYGDMIIVGSKNIDIYRIGTKNFLYSKIVGGLHGDEVFRAVNWVKDNKEAYIVGNNSASGMFCHYTVDNHRVSRLPNPVDSSNTQNGISTIYDPSPVTLSAGDNHVNNYFMISRTSAFKETITENVAPEIEHIDMYDEEGDPSLRKQIDVNSEGSMNYIYEIYVRVSHSKPDMLEYVEVALWFDEGAVGNDSVYPPEDDMNRTRAFKFNASYDDGSTSFNQIYPVRSENFDYGNQTEVVLDVGNCFSFYDNSSTTEVWELYFAFSLGPQMRYANGDGGTFNGPPYGSTKEEGLATPDTWDLHVSANDKDNLTDNMYGEFGIYKYMSLNIAGLPDTYSGMGAPGQTIELSTSSLKVVKFSANCPHRLKVYAETDLKSDTSGDIIPATSLTVQGGYSNQTLDGYGETHAVYLLGDDSPMFNPPRGKYNFTTTQFNTVNETFTDYPELRWWVFIPTGISKGVYTANIIYVLEHEG